MFGAQRGSVIGGRSAPYAPSYQQSQGGEDPARLAALTQLLRTIADRAQNMSTQEILSLNAAFAAACNGLGGQAAASAIRSLTDSQSYHPEGDMGPLPTLEEVGGGLNSVKVSSRANVKSVAGAMAKSLRNNDMLCATAVGPEGANHGMKALSIARCYLAADGLDLSATVVEVQPDPTVREGRCFAFVVVRIQVPAKTGDPLCEAGVGRTEPLPRFVRPEEKQTDMKVSGAGNAHTLGGAISKCLREDKECIVTAIGPAAVAKCVEAMALARSHVWNDGLQLAFYPGFEHIIMDSSGPGAGESRSAIRVHVWPEVAQGGVGGGFAAPGGASSQQAIQQWA